MSVNEISSIKFAFDIVNLIEFTDTKNANAFSVIENSFNDLLTLINSIETTSLKKEDFENLLKLSDKLGDIVDLFEELDGLESLYEKVLKIDTELSFLLGKYKIENVA